LIALVLTDPFDTLTYENLAPVAASGLMKSKLRSLLLLLQGDTRRSRQKTWVPKHTLGRHKTFFKNMHAF